MKKHMEFGTRRAIRDVLRQIRVGTLELEEGSRRAIRDVLRQIRVGTLELEEGRMRLRGMSTLHSWQSSMMYN